MNTAWRRSCQPACLLQAGGKHTANPFRAEFKGKTLTANLRVVILGCNMPDCVIELPSTAGGGICQTSLLEANSSISSSGRRLKFRLSNGSSFAGMDSLISCPFNCQSWLCKVIRPAAIPCWSVSSWCCAGTADGTRWSTEA